MNSGSNSVPSTESRPTVFFSLTQPKAKIEKMFFSTKLTMSTTFLAHF